MLRGGYRTKFPQQPNPTENQIQEAKICDSYRKEVANAKINASRWRKYPKIIQGGKVLVKRSSKTNKFASQFEPTLHMVTDVQDSLYELIADNDYNNMHSIFRHISDIKLYKPYQHHQRYHPPTQSRHKYSSLNNTPADPAPNDTASPYAASFGPDHTPYNKTATTSISRPPNTNTTNERERWT